jgi:hypothetical protein
MIVGEDQFASLSANAKRSMMSQFEMGIKRHFGSVEKDYSVTLRGVEDDTKQGIDDERIKVP